MIFGRAVATAILVGANASLADELSWFDAWYNIEVIVFTQHLNLGPEALQAEELIVEGPAAIALDTRVFPLTRSERSTFADRSLELDLSLGDDVYFFKLKPRFDSVDRQQPNAPLTLFPDWLLAPGESYDPFLVKAFATAPFHTWFVSEFLAELSGQNVEGEEDLENLADPDLPQDAAELIGDELVSELEVEQPAPTREDILTLVADYREVLESTAYQMEESGVRLIRTAERLRNNSYDVLGHFHWQQPVPDWGTGSPLLFQTEDGSIQGFLGVERGRYLHFTVDLWMEAINGSQPAIEYPVYALNETRRLQRNEVHYFDHPKFGVLAQVQKLTLPEDLDELVQTIQ